MTALDASGAKPITILHGTDFTRTALDAGEVAAALAAAFEARLRLVHVLDPSLLSWLGSREQASLREATLDALRREADRLHHKSGAPVDSVLLEGSPGWQLAHAADDGKAALIVVAAAGPTPSIFKIGGTAERVAQAARVPVLLVREPAPLRRWLGGERLAIAAFIADDAASDHAIEWLRTLRRIGASDVAAFHAYDPATTGRRYGLTPRSVVGADPELEGYLRRDLEARVGTLGGRGELSCHAVPALGRIADHLFEQPAAARADLVVVGNHRARGIARLSSVAAGVVHLAPMSILVVPADAPSLGPAPWPRIRRVLAATDFSAFASAAIRQAYGLVAAGGGEVVLLHVMTEPSSAETPTEDLARLRALVPADAPAGVTTSVEALWHSDAAAGILQVAERLGADVIVVASHGRGGLGRMVLGSVAQDVVRHGHRPVLLVLPPSDA